MPAPYLTVMTRRFSGLFLVLALIVPCLPAVAGDGRYSPLAIETADGRELVFSVEVADEPRERRIGLMFRREMAEDRGMLFLYDAPQIAAFWMQNTYIPLDMLFIAADGTIVDLHSNAEPLSEEIIRSDRPVDAILEINGGLIERLGIARGDSVRHMALETLAEWRARTAVPVQ